MSMEDRAANDCCKKSSCEGSAGGVVGSLHEVASDSSLTNYHKANRGGEGRKENRPDTAQRVKTIVMSVIRVQIDSVAYPATVSRKSALG
jgi:hypothetical protein